MHPVQVLVLLNAIDVLLHKLPFLD